MLLYTLEADRYHKLIWQGGKLKKKNLFFFTIVNTFLYLHGPVLPVQKTLNLWKTEDTFWRIFQALTNSGPNIFSLGCWERASVKQFTDFAWVWWHDWLWMLKGKLQTSSCYRGWKLTSNSEKSKFWLHSNLLSYENYQINLTPATY